MCLQCPASTCIKLEVADPGFKVGDYSGKSKVSHELIS
jgi:hypothetical protein